MYTSQKQQNTRYIRGIYSCVWRLDSFPGVRLRGSWHFEVAGFHLTIKNGPSLCPLNTIFPSWASVAGGVCRPRSEAPCIIYHTTPEYIISHFSHIVEMAYISRCNTIWYKMYYLISYTGQKNMTKYYGYTISYRGVYISVSYTHLTLPTICSV